MILSENKKYLMNFYPKLLNRMNLANNKGIDEKISPVITKTGLPSLLIEKEGKSVYLHSKYDPINEAEQWFQQYEKQLSQFNHIFFYGIGFGYHVELLMHKYPNKWFTLYEPNPNIFYEYLCHRNLNALPLNKLKALYVENESVEVGNVLSDLLEQFSEEFFVFPQPIYERIFEQKTTDFFNLLKQKLNSKASEVSFLKDTKELWSVNCMENFRKVLETPNIIRELKLFFKDKPTIIVAAGPSLEEDIGSIRIIKEQGLAYIFAVGSANKALISHGIYPDAICTYDPFKENFQVFDVIIRDNITQIPLIFGTSVEPHTVAFYPGPMLHMVSSRDPIAKYYLEDEKFLENNEIVFDEATITLVTMNLLYKLGCDLIIFAGLNLAYKNEQFYSKGIKHEYLTNELLENMKQDSVFVESVDGEQILSWGKFNIQRIEMEKFINHLQNITVINTTKGGAKIAGTLYMDIEQLISEKLRQPVVQNDWYKVEKTNYNMNNLLKQTTIIERDYEQFSKMLSDIVKTLSEMEKFHLLNKNQRLSKTNNHLATLLHEMQNNKFYSTFLKVELRLENEKLNINLNNIRLMDDFRKKISTMIQLYSKYIINCRRVYVLRSKQFLEFQAYLLNYIKEQELVS